MTGCTALVLAGERSGTDPVAAHAGVAHKALVQIGGRTLLERVVEALRQAGADRIVVSTDNPAVIAAAEALGVERLPTAARPSLSVRDAFDRLGAPLLVTTADHALLRPEWITTFLQTSPVDADLAIAMAERSVVERDAPGTRRTWYRFADGAWSGCNLFLLRTPGAGAALTLWSEVEMDRKRPWRIARLLGLRTLAAYLLGRLALRDAISGLGARVDIIAAVVALPFGLAAVDVDTPADLDLVAAILDRDQS